MASVKPSRNLRLLKISAELLESWLHCKPIVVLDQFTTADVPTDMVIVDMQYDKAHRVIILTVDSTKFSPVLDGEEIPVLSPVYTSRGIKSLRITT